MTQVILQARTAEDFADVKALFLEHIGHIGDERAYIGLETELASLPGKYAPPSGELFLCRRDNAQSVGCVGFRALDRIDACEIKHLYVREAARGGGAGRRLMLAALRFAAAAGYREMLLSTLPSLTAANKLYRSLGFEQVEAFFDEILPSVIYLRKCLKDR